MGPSFSFDCSDFTMLTSRSDEISASASIYQARSSGPERQLFDGSQRLRVAACERIDKPLQRSSYVGSLASHCVRSGLCSRRWRISEGELGPVCYSELMHETAGMHLDSGLGHAEPTGNYLIGEALTEKTEHLLLFYRKDRVAYRSVDGHFAKARAQHRGGKKRPPVPDER